MAKYSIYLVGFYHEKNLVYVGVCVYKNKFPTAQAQNTDPSTNLNPVSNVYYWFIGS